MVTKYENNINNFVKGKYILISLTNNNNFQTEFYRSIMYDWFCQIYYKTCNNYKFYKRRLLLSPIRHIARVK